MTSSEEFQQVPKSSKIDRRGLSKVEKSAEQLGQDFKDEN